MPYLHRIQERDFPKIKDEFQTAFSKKGQYIRVHGDSKTAEKDNGQGGTPCSTWISCQENRFHLYVVKGIYNSWQPKFGIPYEEMGTMESGTAEEIIEQSYQEVSAVFRNVLSRMVVKVWIYSNSIIDPPQNLRSKFLLSPSCR